MRNKFLILGLLFSAVSFSGFSQNDSVFISGIVSDFKGHSVEGALVEIKHSDFKTAYETLTNEQGQYQIKVLKGDYYAMGSLKMSEYPIAGSVLPKEEQRLEFWAWNIIAQEDIVLDIKYHRLEVYGVNIFRVQGAHPGYTIYCRPMSLSRGFAEPNKNLDFIDLCPNPDELDITVKINGEIVKINMMQKVKEYVSSGICNGYLLHVPLPKEKTDKEYDIFHIEMTDLKTGDKGEAVSFRRSVEFL